MDRRRLLLIGLAAILLGGLLSVLTYRRLQQRTATDNGKQFVSVVIAANDIVPSQKIAASDLMIVSYPRELLPDHVLDTKIKAVGLFAMLRISKGDFVSASKLTPDGGLSGRIPPSMRAASVSINDLAPVSGFVTADSLVDVLVTGHAPDHDGLQTRTVLQKVQVLAADTKVLTLLVSPEDAERLALAMHEGRIQLLLRNPRDVAEVETPPVSDSCGGAPKQRAKLLKLKYVPNPAPQEIDIDVYRGHNKDTVKFKQ